MTAIPTNARLVFQGILVDVYQWEQILFDGTTATFEAVQRLPTVQMIATTTDKKIILLEEEQPFVGKFSSLPGGRIERGATPEETVKEELLQELGVQAETLVLWQEHKFQASIQWTSYDYIARNCQKVQEPQPEAGERIKSHLVTFDEFLVQIEDEQFRNKSLSNRMFRMKHSPGKIEEFHELLFPTQADP